MTKFLLVVLTISMTGCGSSKFDTPLANDTVMSTNKVNATSPVSPTTPQTLPSNVPSVLPSPIIPCVQTIVNTTWTNGIDSFYADDTAKVLGWSCLRQDGTAGPCSQGCVYSALADYQNSGSSFLKVSGFSGALGSPTCFASNGQTLYIPYTFDCNTNTLSFNGQFWHAVH